MNELYAFWTYDQFPGVLGGKCHAPNDEGMVYVPSYRGYFKPVLVMSEAGGLKLNEKIIQLKIERHDAVDKINREYEKKFKSIWS